MEWDNYVAEKMKRFCFLRAEIRVVGFYTEAGITCTYQRFTPYYIFVND